MNIYIGRERLHSDDCPIAVDTGRPTIEWFDQLDICDATGNVVARVIHDQRGLKKREIKVWIETVKEAEVVGYDKGGQATTVH